MSEDTTAAAPATTKEPKAPRRGVGTVAQEAIRAGKSNEEALAAVLAEFPEAKTSLQTISWYRNDMRKSDSSIPSGRQIRAAAKAAEPAATEASPSADPLG